MRLEMHSRIASFIEPEISLPAVGQGAVGIECRLDDIETLTLLAPLNHQPTSIRVTAERAMNLALEGGCQVPIGSYALLNGDQIFLRGLVGSIDGTNIIRKEITGHVDHAQSLGEELAQQLLNAGAKEILSEVYQ